MSLPNPNSMVSAGKRAPVCATLAVIIREQRLQRGLSLSQLAARAGISRRMLGFIENHERVPTIDTLTRISQAFGLKSSELLCAAELDTWDYSRMAEVRKFC